MGLILDTNFIITADREANRGSRDTVNQFFSQHEEEPCFINFTIAGELACGRSAADKRKWERLCEPYPVLPWSSDISWQYGEIYRLLSGKGMLIGANDMWIAATAMVHGHGVVTNNVREFGRIPGLSVLSY